jgi:hypothetical protein
MPKSVLAPLVTVPGAMHTVPEFTVYPSGVQVPDTPQGGGLFTPSFPM